MAAGGRGFLAKVVAGCSGCLVIVFLALVIAFRMLPRWAPDTVPPEALRVVGWGQYLSGACCCVAGVGLVIGIVLLLTGNKEEPEP